MSKREDRYPSTRATANTDYISGLDDLVNGDFPLVTGLNTSTNVIQVQAPLSGERARELDSARAGIKGLGDWVGTGREGDCGTG